MRKKITSLIPLVGLCLTVGLMSLTALAGHVAGVSASDALQRPTPSPNPTASPSPTPSPRPPATPTPVPEPEPAPSPTATPVRRTL
jgi:hypothetical protein